MILLTLSFGEKYFYLFNKILFYLQFNIWQKLKITSNFRGINIKTNDESRDSTMGKGLALHEADWGLIPGTTYGHFNIDQEQDLQLLCVTSKQNKSNSKTNETMLIPNWLELTETEMLHLKTSPISPKQYKLWRAAKTKQNKTKKKELKQVAIQKSNAGQPH